MHKLKPISQVSMIVWLFILLAGCQTTSSNFSAFLENRPEHNLPETVVLPKDYRQIQGKSTPENMVFEALELTNKKRFVEARRHMREVRDLQYRGSEGHQDLTSSMAILSLKQGDIPSFRRLGTELDMSLGKPLKVATKHLPVICLSRALSGEALPINCPETFIRFRNTYLPKAEQLS